MLITSDEGSSFRKSVFLPKTQDRQVRAVFGLKVQIDTVCVGSQNHLEVRKTKTAFIELLTPGALLCKTPTEL